MHTTKTQEDKKNNSTKKRMGNTDIIEVLMEDHKPLKTLIEIMKDSELKFKERRAAFEEFAPILVAHAKPEEEVLYGAMKKQEALREKAFEGDVEHGLADQLVEEIKRIEDEDLCSASIKVLAELVEHHIEEEEEELLPAFKKNSEAQEREKLGNLFLQLKVTYLAAGDDNVIPDPKTEIIKNQ